MEDDKLIAIFMGRRQRRNGLIYTFEMPIYGEVVGDKILQESSYTERCIDGTVDKLLYKTSWDWLMPVVNKIETLGYTTSFKTHYCRINPIDGDYDNYIVRALPSGIAWQNLDYRTLVLLRKQTHPFLTDTSPQISKKDMIYICVVEFIKWYNTQQ